MFSMISPFIGGLFLATVLFRRYVKGISLIHQRGAIVIAAILIAWGTFCLWHEFYHIPSMHKNGE